jgi:hypothetical protein
MRRFTLVFLAILVLSVTVTLVVAEANVLATYMIPWWTVDGGGGTSQGGGYTLSGTAGQPDAGNANGGTYSLRSGFWQVNDFPHKIYLPMIIR